MGFVWGVSVCVREGEEEMSELFFARFLVVSELGGDGGHVPRIQTIPFLSLPLSNSFEPERAHSAYVITHTSLPANAQKIMGIKHFDSEPRLSLDRPPTHTAQTIWQEGNISSLSRFPFFQTRGSASTLATTSSPSTRIHLERSLCSPQLAASRSPSHSASKQTSGLLKSFESNPSSFFPVLSRKSAGSMSSHT